MIKGVGIKKLKVNYDTRGHLMEILRRDDKIFKRFGQVYITTANPGVVKAWHYHKLQDDYFCCVFGKMRLALYDARKKSETYGKVMNFELGLNNPKLVKIPKGVYHGFKCISDVAAIVVNTPTLPYNKKKPDEYRVDAFNNDIPYNWKK
ncbi:MAG: dTDP-4-dehydrorhamnose 3,5-epimerase family protein [Candidatus Omnitrophica bacterium]|jgi:dTDP-4-dehydrorhamnose 3,5-epimerase|nr:dTDP-4-dehydrorhamnose 3,5-epimerase family protein [Candidatus Omnitrophota bacterium]